jgi:hypothetical protein
MTSLTGAGPADSPFDHARAVAARHPHAALLVAVVCALVTEPAVQAGRDAASNLEYVGAAAGLAARAAIALACLFVAWEGQRRLRLAPVLGCAALLGLGWLMLHVLIGVEPDQDLSFYAEDGSSLLDGTYPRSEYPTGAVGLFALETWVGGEPPRAVHAIVMLAMHLAVVAALTPAAFLLTNRVFSSQFLVLLVAVWAFAAAIVVVSEREQLAVGVAMAGATFPNALVHPYTVPVAWELASAAMFALALGLTTWLVVRAASAPAEAAPT